MSITVEDVAVRLPSWAGAASRSVTSLPGGITNVNYRVDIDEESYVVRIPAARDDLLGIDRRREYRCTVAAWHSGVAPEVVAFLPDSGVLVTRFIPGHRPTSEEMTRPEMIARIIASMRLYHGGPPFEGTFSPFRAIEHYLAVGRRHGAPLPADVDALHARLAEIEAALGRTSATVRPCHNDLWDPNLIDDGTRIRILDWEYAGMGDVYFDLASFAVHHDLSAAQQAELLRGYFGEVSGRAVDRLALCTAAAELREAMWCMAGMFVSSSTDFDFIGYAATHFEQYRRRLDDPRVSGQLAGSDALRRPS